MRPLTALLALLPVIAWAGESAWNIEADESGYETVTSLGQDAANTIKDESYSKEVTPRLSFNCTPGDAAVTANIDWKRFISSFSTEVGFKVDGGKFTWLKWRLDDSEKVTLSPSADDSKKLIDLLASGEKLLVEISPYSEGPVEVEFDLTGFADSLVELGRRCQ
jgi:hypothetical protein